MKIAEVYKTKEVELKGFSVSGRVFWLGKPEEFTSKKSGKKFSVTKFGISDGDNKETDSIYCSIYSDKVPEDFKVGALADFMGCAIRAYTNKEGKEQRELQVGEIVPKGAVTKETPTGVKPTPKAAEKKEEMTKQDWEEKDKRMCRLGAIKDEAAYISAVSVTTAALIGQGIVNLEEDKLELVMERIHSKLKALGEIDRKEFEKYVLEGGEK